MSARRLAQLGLGIWIVAHALGCGSDESTLPERASPTAVPVADGGAPIVDSGAPVVPTDSGSPTTDPCSGRKVCDSFEGADFAKVWKKTLNNGTVEISSDHAFTGTHAAKFKTNAVPYQQAYLEVAGAPLFPLTTNILYGRMMVWLDTPAANKVHWTMISGDGPVPSKNIAKAYYRYGGQPQNGDDLMANYDTSKPTSTDCWQHSKTKMPIGKWTCFAWKLDGVSQELHIAMNGTPIADLDVIKKGQGCLGNDLGGQWLAPSFTSTTIGWESYQQDVGHTMYIDDVILDTAPVDCPVMP